MTNVTISPNRLTSSGKLDSSADVGGGLRPILLGRMDISMVADGADLLNSSATNSLWTFDHVGATLTKYTEGGKPYARGGYVDNSVTLAESTPSINFLFPSQAAPQEFYFQFWARRDGSIAAGCKLVKAHDRYNGSANYSNTTWNNGYDGSAISSIAYGDGTNPTNDNTELLYYNTGGTYQTVNRPVEGTWASGRFPSVMTPLPRTFVNGGSWTEVDWGNGTTWHKFQMRVKVNSGNSVETEVNDGLYEVWVDGVLRCAGYNIMNRHYASARFSKLEFMSYSTKRPAFFLDMRDITVSTGGWID